MKSSKLENVVLKRSLGSCIIIIIIIFESSLCLYGYGHLSVGKNETLVDIWACKQADLQI